MNHLFARVIYGVPEAFFRALRPFKIPIVLFAAAFVIVIANALFSSFAAWFSHDPRWLQACIMGAQNAANSFQHLAGTVHPSLVSQDDLRAIAARVTPLQEQSSMVVKWSVQLVICLLSLAAFWVAVWFSIRPFIRYFM